MRRKDKEITDRKAIEQILIDSEVLSIAMCDDGEPYIVAMNYAYADNCIYMHSATEGRKIDILRKNNRIAFQTYVGEAVIIKDEACKSTSKYLSVFGTGKALLLDDKAEKKRALDAIMTKHTGKTEFEYHDGALDKVLIIKVEISSITGKKSGYQGYNTALM